MKRIPRWTPLFLLLALAGACEAPPADDTDTPHDTVAEPGPPFVTIQLAIQGDSIVVTPDSADVPRGQPVAWQGAESGDVWVVVFTGSTPMRADRRVLNGGGPANARDRIAPQAQLGEYKYWVFYPDGQGGYLQLDPKLVIIDD